MGLPDGIERRLLALKEKEFLMAEFIKHASRLISALVGRQVRYKVTDLPDVRTVRYYVQRGLIDKPSRRGRQAVFRYRHLLQVLLIKKLQSRYLPLRKIAETMQASDLDLEEFLIGGWTESELLGTSVAGRPASAPAAHLRDSGDLLVPSASLPAIPRETMWRRLKIDEGLELLIEESFGIDGLAAAPDVIAKRIMQILCSSSRAKGDRSLGEVERLASGPRAEVSALPAPPVPHLSDAVVALITEGGLVPRGNPDRLEAHRASRFLKYNIDGIADLKRDAYESVTGGWDTTYVNADPDRLLPLDVMRELERKKVIGKTHHYFYTTTGVAMSIDMARNIGRALAADLKREGVTAAILTAT
jgi:DNA-binding transcriptional MerR regulator